MTATQVWPDDVKRVKDAMDVHAVGGSSGQYAVFSLQTGAPVVMDVFPSRRDARRMAEKKTTDALLILEVSPDGMPYNEAAACLKYERALWSAGVRTPDSLESEHNSGLLSVPRTKKDRRRMAQQLISGIPEMPDGLPYGNLPYYLRKGL
jgi:hypothetical protein